MLTPDITTDRFVLAILSEAEATETYRSWMADPELVQFLESRGSVPTLDDLRSYIASMRASDDSYFFGIFVPDGRRHIGNIKLGPISAMHHSASIGLVLGERDMWGKGVATEVVGALSDWAFGTLGLEKLYAGSYASNPASVRAFQRRGFAIEGVQRRHVQLDDGSRDDVIVLGRTRDDEDRPIA
jgi:RimJ/RimL family protein N-acetyltransferase